MKGRRLLAVSSLGMLIFGLTSAIIGPLLVPMSESFNLSLSQAGRLVSFRYQGFLLSAPLVGLLWQKRRARIFLVGSSFVLSIALLTMGLWPVWPVICALLLLVGLSGGLVHTGVDSLLSEVYSDVRTRILNLVHIFFGVGALLGPIIVGTVLLFFGWWNLVYCLVGIGALTLFVFFLTQDLKEKEPPLSQTHSGAWKNLTCLTTSAPFWLLTLGMFFYLGAEVSLLSWVPMFLARVRDASAVAAGYTNSVFWVTLLVGRTLFVYLSVKRSPPKLLIFATLGLTCSTVGVFWFKNPVLIITSLASAGFFSSGIYPTILALGGQTFPDRIGMIIGILTAAGSLGGICFPWLLGVWSEHIGLTRGVFMIPVVMGLTLAMFVHFERRLTTRIPTKIMPVG